MPRHLRHPARAISPVTAALSLIALAGCQPEPAPERNASDEARFASDMDEMQAGQARTDANVAEIAADQIVERRQEIDERQQRSGNDQE